MIYGQGKFWCCFMVRDSFDGDLGLGLDSGVTRLREDLGVI